MSRLWACVLGHPIGHSLSPTLHNRAFADLGLDAHYDARDVLESNLPGVLHELRQPFCLGANVTAPHKQAVAGLVDALADDARILGVVNTIVRCRDGRLIGDNTDALGLAAWLRSAVPSFAGGRALVLGAGGASRAAVLALGRSGAHQILVLNRTPGRAEDLVRELGSCLPGVDLTAGPLRSAEGARSMGDSPRIVINATSLGHMGQTPEVHSSWLTRDTFAVDLAYNPPTTLFMRLAKNAGAAVDNGLGMLVAQAELACTRWLAESQALLEAEPPSPERIHAAYATARRSAEHLLEENEEDTNS